MEVSWWKINRRVNLNLNLFAQMIGWSPPVLHKSVRVQVIISCTHTSMLEMGVPWALWWEGSAVSSNLLECFHHWNRKDLEAELMFWHKRCSFETVSVSPSLLYRHLCHCLICSSPSLPLFLHLSPVCPFSFLTVCLCLSGCGASFLLPLPINLQSFTHLAPGVCLPQLLTSSYSKLFSMRLRYQCTSQFWFHLWYSFWVNSSVNTPAHLVSHHHPAAFPDFIILTAANQYLIPVFWSSGCLLSIILIQWQNMHQIWHLTLLLPV